MKHNVLCFLFLFALVLPAFSEESFADWQKKRNREFAGYKNAIDAEFSKFLKQRWKSYNLYRGIKPYEEDKPKALPALPKPAEEVKNDTPPIDLDEDIFEEVLPDSGLPKKNVPLLPVPPPKNVVVPKEERKTHLKTDFFGQEVILEVDPRILSLKVDSAINAKSIAKAWQVVGGSDYEPMVSQMKIFKSTLKVNGWGYGNLVQKVSKSMFPKSKNSAAFMTWFLMLKSGYDARLVYSDTDLMTMAASREMLYGTPYIRVKGKKYFNTNFEGLNPPKKKFKTYPTDYPGGLKPIDIRFSQYPLLGQSNPIKKNLSFKYQNEHLGVKLSYDKNFIRYINSFPKTTFETFLSAPMNPQAGPLLLEFAGRNVKGKNQVEAVNFLLHFVQNAFKYKTDDDQFGFEKYFFPDEVIFYEYSDCEDRVALFSYLVRNLLKLDIVALHYPNHLAAAVRFDGKVDGDAITHKGKKYVITDPTYINASAGMAMPNFKNKNPKVIVF